jgi:hypothetical protein
LRRFVLDSGSGWSLDLGLFFRKHSEREFLGLTRRTNGIIEWAFDIQPWGFGTRYGLGQIDHWRSSADTYLPQDAEHALEYQYSNSNSTGLDT